MRWFESIWALYSTTRPNESTSRVARIGITVKKKISKRTREQAALVCAIAASTPSFTESYTMVLLCADITREAYDLAFEAWDAASCGIPYLPDGDANPIVDAEAEAMLRTGWSPS